MDNVLVSRADGVCELRLNRPEKRNAITTAMYDALWDALVQAEADESVRVVLLSGAGASFTAGNDLVDFMNQSGGQDDNGPVRFLRLLPKIRKVLVAAVHGPTVGIGFTMLLHCDLVLAARSTRLSMPFVKLGLVPEAASSLLLPRFIGHQRCSTRRMSPPDPGWFSEHRAKGMSDLDIRCPRRPSGPGLTL
jgi:enoyl-CoA hydratase/carnithine racemase